VPLKPAIRTAVTVAPPITAGAVPADELAQAVAGAGGAGRHRLVLEVPPQVLAECGDGVVAPGAFLLEVLRQDPVQVAAELGRELPGSMRREPAISSSPPMVLSRVLGLGVWPSRMTRCISARPALRSRSGSSGVAPVSSS